MNTTHLLLFSATLTACMQDKSLDSAGAYDSAEENDTAEATDTFDETDTTDTQDSAL